jgi:predicted GNAT family N-acyltransferase
MSDVTVFDADDPGFEDAVDVRERVFVEGQGVPHHRELDGKDDEATHFLLRVDGDPAATARLRRYGSMDSGERTGKVERVAVLEGYRGQGYGDAVMDAVETHAADDGYDRLVLDAQTHVVEFYGRRGYEVTSDEPFEDAGIPHLRMEQPL